MRSPSSTSSSKKQRSDRAPIIAAAMAVTVVLLCALNYRVDSFLLPYWPQSEIGKIIQYLRDESLKALEAPSVLFLGSSRFRSAIVPSIFEGRFQERSAWAAGARFLDCSQPSLSYWEFSKVFSRIDLDALKARVCVLEVDPWTFNRYGRHPVTKELVRHRFELGAWGTFQEIMSVDGALLKGKLLWQRYLPRHSLADYVQAIRCARETSPLGIALPPAPYHVDRIKEDSLRTNLDFSAEHISRCQMIDYEFSKRKADDFCHVVKNIENHGITVMVVHPPVRKEYFEYIESSPKRNAEFGKHRAFLQALSAEHVVVNWQVPEDAGMKTEAFVDYGHFTLQGAKTFSEALADRLIGPIEQAITHPPER